MPNRLVCLVRRHVLALIVLLVTEGFCLQASESEWYARSWQSDDGLTDNTIYGVVQTPDGYLWLGTPSDLVRFDGIRFESFSPTNFLAPPNRGTLAMLNGRDGSLWLAMDRGAVVCLNGDSTRVFTTALPNVIPNGMAEDAEGNLWVAYRAGAVYRIKDGSIKLVGPREGMPVGNDICALTADRHGRLWFAKGGQVGIFQNGSLRTIREFPAQPARLAASRAGGVWLCLGFHLYRLQDDGEVEDAGEFKPERAGTIATALLEDHEGAVWIGTSYSGLFRHDRNGFETVSTTHQGVLSLAEDREGNLWVGTEGGGLDRVRRRFITLEGTEAGLPFAAVQSICEDAEGVVWAATQNGSLARRTGGRWSVLPSSEGWPLDVTCVAADPRGSIWIGTRGHGLVRWHKGRFRVWGQSDGIKGQTLHTLLVSRAGDVWIGEETPNAVQRLRGDDLSSFEIPTDSRVIRAMTEDANGDVWFGTSKGILFRFHQDQLTTESFRPAGALAPIRCLASTPDGSVWVGYAGWGIGRIKDGKYAEIRSEHGLFDDYISHIVADGRGWLWFGANRGIFRVPLQQLNDLADGHLGRIRSIHYGRGEGLPSLQGTFGDSPDTLRSRDGRLWIPMRTALGVVDPAKLHENAEPPALLLKRVSVDDRTAAWNRGVLPTPAHTRGNVLDLRAPDARLRLPPGHRRIGFEFASLSFSAAENIHFRYRLEGVDEDWVEAGTDRTAVYSRLSEGRYRFRVTACNADGVWNEEGAALGLVVSPFVWQRWWFRGALLGAFTLAVVALVRYVSFRRLRQRLVFMEQQAALHRERARIAKDIHDDLGANLTQIALLGELAQQDQGEPDKSTARIETISTTARQAIKALDEIVWAVNPRNDTLAHLVDYSGQFAIDYLRVGGIRCRLDFPEQTPARELSTDLRHNLFLAIKEALHNVVKHSRATEVWLRVSAGPEELLMTVADDGCGFEPPTDNALADGLRNMRQRMAEIGGECRIESQAGSGTKVVFRLPWPNGGPT